MWSVRKDMKSGLLELEKILDHISFCRRTRTATEDARKSKATALAGDSPLQIELAKKCKVEDVFEGDLLGQSLRCIRRRAREKNNRSIRKAFD